MEAIHPKDVGSTCDGEVHCLQEHVSRSNGGVRCLQEHVSRSNEGVRCL